MPGTFPEVGINLVAAQQIVMSKIHTAVREWDVIIVGAGPAGSAAAMVLARMRRSVLILDGGEPRNKRSHGMHNYLSRDGMLPTAFLKTAHGELDHYKVDHIATRAIAARKDAAGHFVVTDAEATTYHCKRLLLATGVTDNIPDVKGMRELWGCGVFHCPYCDGFELCDKSIGLYAQRINGFGMALSLLHLTKKVTLFTDGAGYLKKSQIAILNSQGIGVIHTRIDELHCDDNKLTCVGLRNGAQIPCDAVFVNHGHKVNNDLLLQLGARCTLKGAAVTNRKQQCSIPGLYVAGDAAIDIHFVAVAAAEGTKAAVAIHDDLMQEASKLLTHKSDGNDL